MDGSVGPEQRGDENGWAAFFETLRRVGSVVPLSPPSV